MYDVWIAGGGPAGLTAGLYAARAGLRVLLIEGEGLCGGQAALTGAVENYPGFPEGIFGADLMAAFEAQARGAGLEIATATLGGLRAEGDRRIAVAGDGREWAARCAILAMGAKPRRLGVPGESEWIGRGVSYCAACDGALYRGKRVAVVGGGDTAVGDALYLARFAASVALIHRRDRLRAKGAAVAELMRNDRIMNHFGRTVDAVERDGEGLRLRLLGGEPSELRVDGLFVAVGTEPNSGCLRGIVDLDGRGYAIAGEDAKTSLAGVFAAGDLRAKPFRQIVTAAADGAVAAEQASRYLDGIPW